MLQSPLSGIPIPSLLFVLVELRDLMKKEMNLDMTVGSPVRHLLVFSLPMLVGNLFQQVYNLVDSIIVGQFVGANALAAIGATSSICFFFFALCNGIGSGGGIITSQFFGAGDEARVKRSLSNVAYIMVVFPFIVGILAFFLAGPLLEVLKTPADIMADALAYVRIMCVGLLFVSVYNYISSMLRAMGDSKTPLYFLIFSCLLNVVLDLIFVCNLKMGCVGAGIATLISQFISGMCCIVYAFKRNPMFKLKKEDLTPDKSVLWSAIRLGVPLSLQFSLIAISSMALQRVVNAFGASVVAAFTATGRIEQIIHQPYQTLSSSISTFCGQNYGARKKDRVLQGYRKGIIIMVIFTAIMVPLVQIFSRQITALFVPDEAVIDIGARALKITSIFYITLGLIYTVRGLLNGVGDAFFAMFNGVVEVIGRFTVPVIMTMYTPAGMWGIWWSAGIVWFISGGTAWLRYKYYWKKVDATLS